MHTPEVVLFPTFFITYFNLNFLQDFKYLFNTFEDFLFSYQFKLEKKEILHQKKGIFISFAFSFINIQCQQSMQNESQFIEFQSKGVFCQNQLGVEYVPITYHNSVNFLINTLMYSPITQRLAKNWYPIHNLFIQIVGGLDVSILIIQIAKNCKIA